MQEINGPDNSNSGESDGYDPEAEARRARFEAMTDPEQANSDDDNHDPYSHLRPYHWRKGQSGNPRGRAPGIRTLARRFRQAGTLRPADIKAFSDLAQKLGLEEETRKGMDIIDLLTISTYLHAISGKGPALMQVIKTLTGTINYTPNDSKDKTPEQWREDAIRFYEAVLCSPDVDVNAKITARSKLDVIQGLTNDSNTMGAEQLADEIRTFLDQSLNTVPESEDDDDDDVARTPIDTNAISEPAAE